MPVVFDEVIGSVEPETRSSEQSGTRPAAAAGQTQDAQSIRRELRRQQVRQARLRAD